MKDRDVRKLLLSVPMPDELEAQRRVWRLLQAAFSEREPVTWPRRHARPLIAAAVGFALLAAALTPPGRALVREVREVVGREKVVGAPDAEKALFSLPATGRLLVVSAQGPWVVQKDGSKRFLGRYREASWSPSARFVVVARHNEVRAIGPTGNFRWTLARPQTSFPRWAPTGLQVAYLSKRSLRVVEGDGDHDRLLAEGVAPIAPAWKPSSDEHILAYADRFGRIRVVNTNTGRQLWRARGEPHLLGLEWSSDGRLLVVARGRVLLYEEFGRLAFASRPPRGALITAAAVRPGGHEFAYATFARVTRESRLFHVPHRPRLVRSERASFGGLAWSPDGRWLAVTWPAADQLLFVPIEGAPQIVAVSNIRQQFGFGPPRSFPRLAGWCCP